MRWWLWVAAVAVLLLGLAALVAANAEKMGSSVDPSTKQTISEYRLFGRWKVEVSDATNATTDLANGLVLAVLAGVGLAAATAVRELRPGERRLQLFFVLVFAGAGYLALDEVLELNETYNYNLEGLGRFQDLDIAVYGAALVAFAWSFRDVLLSSRRALWLATAGFAIFVVAELADAISGRLNAPEEMAEPLASALVVAAMLVLAVEQLGRLLTSVRR